MKSNGGGKVYVHCMLGVGRSVTLIAAYLVAEGMTVDDAWRLIRRRRPFIQPTEVQMAQLERWAEIYEQALAGEVIEPQSTPDASVPQTVDDPV